MLFFCAVKAHLCPCKLSLKRCELMRLEGKMVRFKITHATLNSLVKTNENTKNLSVKLRNVPAAKPRSTAAAAPLISVPTDPQC